LHRLKKSSPEVKNKQRVLLSSWIKALSKKDDIPLAKFLNTARDEAQQHRLTENTLHDILING